MRLMPGNGSVVNQLLTALAIPLSRLFKAQFGHTQSDLDTIWAHWREEPSLGCRGLSLRFPTLACQEHGAWNGSLTTRVIGHLAPRQAECLGCIAQTQAMAPPPSDEFQGVQMPILFECHLPQSIRPHVNLTGPYDAVSAFSLRGKRENLLIP